MEPPRFARTAFSDRGEAAARDLADRGRSVTARAVREAAGVSMVVAAATAKAWREASGADSEFEIPEVPADVTARLTATWADAYRAAVSAVSPERDRLAAEVEALRAEKEALTETVADVEAERDEASQERDAIRTEQQSAARKLAEANQALSTREATITELRSQNDRLSGQLAALIARVPAAGRKAD